MLFLNSLLLVSSLVGRGFSRVFHDPNDADTILGGATLLPYCWSNTQVCETHFGKNVFATVNPVMDREWVEALFPDMYNQFDDEFEECGSGSKFVSMDTCSAIHAPNPTEHEEGSLKVSYVQEQYAMKWNYAMSQQSAGNAELYKYDAFFDNSVAYWVDDLAYYESIWTKQNADIVYLRWQVKNSGKYYYSMITHNGISKSITSKTTRSSKMDGGMLNVGSTLSQYELISDTFSTLTIDGETRNDIIMLESEERAYFDETTDYSSLGSGCYTYPIGARRSVSDLEANIDWYKRVFAATITDDSQIIMDDFTDSNGNLVKYGHIKLYNSEISGTISFFERESGDNSVNTYGDLKTVDMETRMTDVHETYMINPFCGIDKWFDMHYAVDFDDAKASYQILETVMKSGDKYTLYGPDTSGTKFLYIPEPNGHSVQVVFENSHETELYAQPNDWTWCSQECTDEQAEYEYGMDIFEWSESSHASHASGSVAAVAAAAVNVHVHAASSNTEDNSLLIIIACSVLVFGIGSILSAIYCLCRPNKEYDIVN